MQLVSMKKNQTILIIVMTAYIIQLRQKVVFRVSMSTTILLDRKRGDQMSLEAVWGILALLGNVVLWLILEIACLNEQIKVMSDELNQLRKRRS